MSRPTWLAVLLCSIFAAGGSIANEVHDQLIKLPSDKQDRTLRFAIITSGEACPGVSHKMFQGMTRNGDAIWSVACTDGNSFSVLVENDSYGSTEILDCKKLEGTPHKCFTSLSDGPPSFL